MSSYQRSLFKDSRESSDYSNYSSDEDTYFTDYTDYTDYSGDSMDSVCSGVDGDRSRSFYDEIISDTVYCRKIQRNEKGEGARNPKTEIRRSKYISKVFDNILDLSDEILQDWRIKVRAAAREGYTNVNIFQYSKGDKYQGLPIVLLLSGPKNTPNFFKSNGMFSVVDEVRMEISAERFRVTYKYIGKGINVINVDWLAGIFV